MVPLGGQYMVPTPPSYNLFYLPEYRCSIVCFVSLVQRSDEEFVTLCALIFMACMS